MNKMKRDPGQAHDPDTDEGEQKTEITTMRTRSAHPGRYDDAIVPSLQPAK
jgi:hypothetical protein